MTPFQKKRLIFVHKRVIKKKILVGEYFAFKCICCELKEFIVKDRSSGEFAKMDWEPII
jgi:hypothetical protein